ncbi:MAG: DUF882 domain-containing protein [Myxococcota bacterium]|nr:DUF882 domain-containing protein [Myxococcota bacterium]
MRAFGPGGALAVACLAAVAYATAASGQGPGGHSKREGSSASSKPATASRGATRQDALRAIAYLSGKQALVGWHSPSTRSVARDEQGRPMFALTNVNRGESLVVPPASPDGGFASVDLDRIAHLLRAMNGDEHPIDPRTAALVYAIQTHFEVPEIRVVSGYRTPTPGSHSNHGKGRAIDLIVPGIADEAVARFVREIGFVGVGVYPSSQFVHVDIRPRSYFWIDSSGPHAHHRERGILADVAAKSDAAALASGRAPIEPFVLAGDVDAALQSCGLRGPAAAAEDDEEEEN